MSFLVGLKRLNGLVLLITILIMNSKFKLTFGQQSNLSTVFRLNNEKRLIKDLLDNYQVKFGRPVNNMSEKVIVYFGIRLIQLIDLDERNQVLVTNVHTVFKWKDNALKWNKSEYGGLDEIRLPVQRIWTPDIVLYNYADTRLEEKRDALSIINSDGIVKWRPPSIFKSTCQINIQKFPYDQQNCSMKFGSWTYDQDSIDIQFYDGLNQINQEEYTESNEWEILSAVGVRREKKYECCPEVYPDITFYIKMKRKGGFYNYILVLPCLLLTCLTTVLFWLPPESPAKMVLGMNIFTAFFVLLLLLSKNVPSATDAIPLIGAYYCLNMVMIATSTVCCTVVVHIFFRGQDQVPWILRKIFLEFLARIFCMRKPPVLPTPQPARSTSNQKQAQPATIITSINNPSNQSNVNLLHHVNKVPASTAHLNPKQPNSMSSNSLNMNSNEEQINSSLPNQQYQELLQQQPLLNQKQQNQTETAQESNYIHTRNTLQQRSASYYQTNTNQHFHTHQQSTQLNTDLNLSFNLIENDIKEIRDYLRHTRKKLENNDSKSKQTGDWKQIALVLDRSLFFLYLIAIFVSLAIMFNKL